MWEALPKKVGMYSHNCRQRSLHVGFKSLPKNKPKISPGPSKTLLGESRPSKVKPWDLQNRAVNPSRRHFAKTRRFFLAILGDSWRPLAKITGGIAGGIIEGTASRHNMAQNVRKSRKKRPQTLPNRALGPPKSSLEPSKTQFLKDT